MAAVGQVARPHGIRGQVIVNLETDFPQQRFRPGAEMFVKRGGEVERLTVTTVRFLRTRPVIGLTGVDDANAAAELAGAELRVPRAALASLPEGVFYCHELVGCTVETVDGQSVGIVRGVDRAVGGHCLVIEAPCGEVMIPLAADICPTVDPASRRIVVDPPEGLLELNDAVRHRHDISGDGRAGRRRGHRWSRD